MTIAAVALSVTLIWLVVAGLLAAQALLAALWRCRQSARFQAWPREEPED